MDCLDPPLDSVPEDDWFCRDCVSARDLQPSTSGESTKTVRMSRLFVKCQVFGTRSSSDL